MSDARNAVPTSRPPLREQHALEEKCGIKVDTMVAILSVLQAVPTCVARGSIRRRTSEIAPKMEGNFAVHHLIPIVFATHDILWRMRGFWEQNDSRANGLILPISRAQSFASKLPYHAGPHPRYSRGIEVCLDKMARFRDRLGWSSEMLLPVFAEFVAQVRHAVLALPPGTSVNDCCVEWIFDEGRLSAKRYSKR